MGRHPSNARASTRDIKLGKLYFCIQELTENCAVIAGRAYQQSALYLDTSLCEVSCQRCLFRVVVSMRSSGHSSGTGSQSELRLANQMFWQFYLPLETCANNNRLLSGLTLPHDNGSKGKRSYSDLGLRLFCNGCRAGHVQNQRHDSRAYRGVLLLVLQVGLLAFRTVCVDLIACCQILLALLLNQILQLISKCWTALRRSFELRNPWILSWRAGPVHTNASKRFPRLQLPCKGTKTPPRAWASAWC